MNILLFYFAELFAIMFFLTSIDKLLYWHKHMGEMKSYNIIHSSLIKPFLFLFLIGELFVSFSMLFTGINPYNSVVFYILLLTYTTAVATNLIRGNRQISCGCGSILDNDQLSTILIYRNILFMIIYALLIYFNERNVLYHITIFEKVVIGMLALSTILVYGIIKEYKSNLLLLNKLFNKFSEYKGGM